MCHPRCSLYGCKKGKTYRIIQLYSKMNTSSLRWAHRSVDSRLRRRFDLSTEKKAPAWLIMHHFLHGQNPSAVSQNGYRSILWKYLCDLCPALVEIFNPEMFISWIIQKEGVLLYSYADDTRLLVFWTFAGLIRLLFFDNNMKAKSKTSTFFPSGLHASSSFSDPEKLIHVFFFSSFLPESPSSAASLA